MTAPTASGVDDTADTNAARPAAASRGDRNPWISFVEHYGLLVLLAAAIAFFGLYGSTSQQFLSRANLIAILGNQTVIAVVALAALVPLASGYIDLSVGATAGAASITFAAGLTTFSLPLPVAALAACLVGALIGVVNGLLIARFRLGSIIATLATQTTVIGLMNWYTKGSTVGGNMPSGIISFDSGNWLGVPDVSWLLVPVLVATWYLLEQVPFGRHLEAISSSRPSAKLVGISVQRSIFACSVIAGVLAGIAGILLAIRQAGADATTAPSYLFPALTGVFLGATVIRPGRPNVIGTLIGLIFLAVIVSGLTFLGLTNWAPDVAEGCLLAGAALLGTLFARERGGSGMF